MEENVQEQPYVLKRDEVYHPVTGKVVRVSPKGEYFTNHPVSGLEVRVDSKGEYFQYFRPTGWNRTVVCKVDDLGGLYFIDACESWMMDEMIGKPEAPPAPSSLWRSLMKRVGR